MMRLFALCLSLLLGFAACSTKDGPQAAISDRPADGILAAENLQFVADLQVERNGDVLTILLEESPSDSVLIRAAFALASVQATEAVPALQNILTHTNPNVRAEAAFALGQTADSTATESLWTALQTETDPTVQKRLLEALGKTGHLNSLRQLANFESLPDNIAEHMLALGRYGLRNLHDEAAVARLAQNLSAESSEVRRKAAYYFGRMRDPSPWHTVQDTLRQALDQLPLTDPDAFHLIRALDRLRDTQDIPRFQQWLTEASNWRVRTAAASALGGFTDQAEIRSALFMALNDPSKHVGVTAANTLRAATTITSEDIAQAETWIAENPEAWRIAGALMPLFAQNDALPVVMEWIETHTDQPTAARKGLTALGQSGSVDAFAFLQQMAQSEDDGMAAAALGALRTQWNRLDERPATPQAYFDLFVAGLRTHDLARAFTAAPVLSDPAFVELGAVDVLVEVFTSMTLPQDIEPMEQILRALGRIDDDAATDFLATQIAHENPVLRRAAQVGYAQRTGEEPPASETAAPSTQRLDWVYLQALGSYPRLVLEVAGGEIIVELDTEQAPMTVQTVLKFAEEGQYDGVAFHRVVPNFVIQGGDFARGDGFGSPDFAIRSEFTRIPYERGTIGMASAGKDTEGSQFFITHSMQPHLDGGYTAFGTVISGMDLVDQMYEGDPVIRARVIRD